MALAGIDESHLWQQQKLLGSCVVLVGVVDKNCFIPTDKRLLMS